MRLTMTVNEVARFFRVSKKAIYYWMRHDPNFPRGFKKFSTRRFLVSEIERYWASNQRYQSGENPAMEEDAAPKEEVDKRSLL